MSRWVQEVMMAWEKENPLPMMPQSLDMDTVCNTGTMVLIMRGNGATIKQRDKVLSGTLKVTSTTANSKTTWPMAMENIRISTVPSTKVNSETMFKRDTAKKFGSTVLNMLEAMKME